jgi:hypothetical protein
LPRKVIRHIVDNELEGVMSLDAHLIDDEYGREWCMMIHYVNGDSLTMEWLKNGIIGIVDKDKFLNLFLLKSKKANQSNSHLDRNA